LSHAPYLAAADGDVAFSVAVTPSRVRFSVRTLGLRVRTGTVARRSSVRGKVREFSSRSRRRLAEVAHDLGELYAPEWMCTLTMPGEWQSVCPDGRAFKRHVMAWRRRLDRWLRRRGLEGWSALWFLEFQERGAPHLHVILWGPGLSELGARAFAEWVSSSWASVVGHRDPVEREKHLRAGTRVEVMRRPHFGYAVKYARKLHQKRVPEGFRDVGRFWGLWRAAAPKPVTWTERIAFEEAAAAVRLLAATLPEPGQRFAARLVARFDAVSAVSDTFTATVYGRGAVAAVLARDSVRASSGAAPLRAAERGRAGPRLRSGAPARASLAT